MAVQEQTPYIEYVANGVTKSFPITFYFDEKYSQLRVGINDDVIETGWSVVNEQVVFSVAPALDSLVKITRLTTLNREVNYQTYNNSLRPDVLNLDFDRVWYALQEQDCKLGQYDFDYSYAVNKSNQAFQSAYNAMQRADQAYALADQIQPINKGGTGAISASDARNNLNTYSKEEVNALVATGGEGNVVGIAGGGTGGATAKEARQNLDVYSKAEVIPKDGDSRLNGELSVDSLYSYGDITAFSDERIKENISVIPDSLSKILMIKGVTFTRNDMKDTTKKYIGVIAQDVLSVCPEAIKQLNDERGTLTVNYQGLIGLLVEAIKELDKKVKALGDEL